MTVSTVPYFTDPNDEAAAVQSMQIMMDLVATNNTITQAYPSNTTTAQQPFDSYPTSTAVRSANHWVGRCKMGQDSGLDGGTSVIDNTLRVYGTNNLYIVDASIIPEITSANPSAMIVSLAEWASDML